VKILQRHILVEFGKVLIVTLASLIVLFLIVDMVENADDLVEKGVPISESLRFFLLKVPSVLFQTSPMAVLLAVLISLGILNRQGEITAIKAGGIGLLRALSPLLVCGVVLSGAAMFLNESVIPLANSAVDSIESRWIKGPDKVHFGSGGFWFRSSNSFYNIRNININEKRLYGVNIYRFGKPFSLRERIMAREASWKDGHWRGEDVRMWRFSEGRTIDEGVFDEFVFKGLKGPEELLSFESSYEKMTFTELGSYIRGLEKDGYDTTRYRVELYSKLSFPMVNFVMVLIGIPFALRTGRQSGIAAGVGLSVAIGFAYWIVFGITRSLGQSAIIPPVLAAFFPDILFVAIGALMFGYVRQ